MLTCYVFAAMTTGGLELVGSRPPSRLDTRQLTSSRTTHRAASDTDVYNTTHREFNNQTYLTDHSELAFGGKQTPHFSNNKDSMGRTFSRGWLNADNAKQTGAMPSDRPSSRQQSSRSILSDRPPSGCGAKPSATSRRTHKHTERRSVASYVDESLFGSMPQEATFTAPWESSKSNLNKAVISRPPSALKMTTRQPSYVDSTLFGEQIEPTTWLAPWQKPTSRRRPLLFDSSDYRLTVEHNIETVKEYKGRKSSLHRANSLGGLNKPQPWR